MRRDDWLCHNKNEKRVTKPTVYSELSKFI